MYREKFSANVGFILLKGSEKAINRFIVRERHVVVCRKGNKDLN